MASLPKHAWNAAPKEGRGHHSLMSNRRRTAIMRGVIIFAVLTIIYLTFSSGSGKTDLSNFTPDGDSKQLPVRANDNNDKQVFLQGDPIKTSPSEKTKKPQSGEEKEKEFPKMDKPAQKPKPKPQNTAVTIGDDDDADEDDDHAVSSGTSIGERDPKLEKHLTKVLSQLPDEITTRELLRPVQGTGKEKLREMGLRTRSYRTYFEAWEDLHLVNTPDGNVYIRDDIIQYMRRHEDFVETLDVGFAQAVRNYETYRYFLQQFANLLFPWTAPYFADHMTLHTHFKNGGRGIVLSAGDDQAPYLLTSITSFRNLGCTLPIEIMYLGDSDLSEDYRAELEAIPGVITRDMAQMVSDEGWELKGWAGKPFAILLSSFREVIFIDADALFFKDPEVLFEDPLYKQTGTLFFRDRIIMPESKKRWLKQVLPNPISSKARQSRFWTGVSGHMQESGVVVVDKWKHLIAMLLVTRMNGPDRDGDSSRAIVGVYDMVYGDKETYWLGWELVGDQDYAFHEGDAGIIGTLQTEEQIEERLRQKEHFATIDHNRTEFSANTICAPQLLHLDMEGRPLWFNGWILNNKFADKKQRSSSNFDVFLIEPTDKREPDAWQLQEHNEACLTADEANKFSEEEKETLDMIIALAKEQDAYGKE
ncbi:mannosyltransferase putative-domain-containing protein [Xylogone sp. PMI_703]|nr:mannosyltransferase putative-domain-containing protein [Xylogone sp. PMI_703]